MRLVRFMGHICYHLRVTPFVPIVDERSMKVKFQYGTPLHTVGWYFVAVFNICWRVGFFFVTGLWFDLTRAIPVIERAQFYFILSISLFSISLQLAMLLFHRRILDLNNAFQRVNSKLMAYQRLDPHQFKDGGEIYLKLLIVTIFAVSLPTGPLAMALIHFRVHFYQLVRTDYFAITILTGLWLAFVHFVDWMHVWHNVFMAIIFVNTSTGQLKRFM